MVDDIYNALKESFSLSFLDIYFNYPLNNSLDELISDEFSGSASIDEPEIRELDTNKKTLESNVSNQDGYLGRLGIQLDLFAITESDTLQADNLVYEANENDLEAQPYHIENDLEDHVGKDTQVCVDDSEEDSDFQSILGSLGSKVTTKKIEGVNVAYKKKF
nr:hypothetical protein [Psychrobacter sp. PraFG1]UNK04557.1 hypothetical protein MN210_09725 [Psychrobacter sp. PraFG1]